MNKKDSSNRAKKKRKEEDKTLNDKNPSFTLNEIINSPQTNICQKPFLHLNTIHSPTILTRSKTKRSQNTNPLEFQIPSLPLRHNKRMDKKKVSKMPSQYNTGGSSDFIKAALEGFKSNDEMMILSTLTDLCSQLSLANDSLGENANYNELIKQLIVLFDKYPMLPDISMIALNCINYVLDINPRSTNTVIKSNGIEKIVQMAQNVEYIDCVESAIKAIEKMSYENPFILVEKDSFYAVLAFIDFFDLNLRKLALKACVNMAKIGNNIDLVKKHILRAFPNLTVLTKLNGNTDIEKSVVDLSVQCFYYIISGVKNYNYSLNHIDFCNMIIQYGLLENLYEIFIRFISLNDTDDNDDTSNNNNNTANIIISHSKTFTINGDTVKTILKIFESLCQMSGDITNIILNNNTLEMIYKVLNREIGAGLSDLNKKKLTSNSHSMYNELFGVLGAVFPQKAEHSRILLESNKFYFLYFSDKILTLLIDNILHIPSSSSMIGVIRIIYMYCTNTPKEYIVKYINETKLSNIISKNLDSKDSNYIIEVLNLVELIMARVPEQFVIAFIRDGVHNNIKSLITIEESGLYIAKDPILPYLVGKSSSSYLSTEKGMGGSDMLINPKHKLIQNENMEDEEDEIAESITGSKPKITLTKPPSLSTSSSSIVERIRSKANTITTIYFSEKDIQALVLKTSSIINPIEIMAKLNKYTQIIKEGKCALGVLKEIIDLMIDSNVTFYEIEKSEIVLSLCSYFDCNFLLNYTNSFDNERESNVTLTNEYNKDIIHKLTELMAVLKDKDRIEQLLKLLQQCISSMNCFKLYLVEFSGLKNYSHVLAQSISMQNTLQIKPKQMSVKLTYDTSDKTHITLFNDESLRKVIEYFVLHTPVNISIGSDEPIELLKDKLLLLPLENPDDNESNENENDIYNVFNKFFLHEYSQEEEDDNDNSLKEKEKDNMFGENDKVMKFLKEIKNLNKEKTALKKNKEQKNTIEPIIDQSDSIMKNQNQNQLKPKSKSKLNQSLCITEEEVDKILSEYDIRFYIKLNNGDREVIDPSLSLTDFIKNGKNQIPKIDLMTFVSSLSLYFTFIHSTHLSNTISNEMQIESSNGNKSKSEPNFLQSLCSLNENEFLIVKLQKILFEKCYYENIINNKALYNIKRASPFFFLITTIELISSSFRNMFGLSEKIPSGSFENLKMTSLLFKQVKDQYAISTNSIPSWCQEVNKAYPFFTGFPARYLLFKVTAFDLKRSMTNLYVYLRNFLGENLLEDKSINSFTSSIKRVKIKVQRDQIFKDTIALMNDYLNYTGYLEFEYVNETGTGMGPTLEYYSLILKEIITNNSLWYNTEDHSLFPIPSIGIDKNEIVNRKKIFECLGFVIARAIFDDRLIDIPLNAFFWDLLLNRPVNIEHIRLIDKNVSDFLLQLQRLAIMKESSSSLPLLLNNKTIESCDIFFTFPNNNIIPLKENGSNIQLTSENMNEYIWLVFKRMIIEGQREWIDAFTQGFNKVFSITQMKCFSSNEIEEIICGSEASDDLWTNENLIQNVIPMHGFNKDSLIYQGLIAIMTQMNKIERKMFLLFVTGAPRLPIGGFKNLHPKLTVVMYQSENKILDQYPDSHLPSVMTCQNYLKIPNYSSVDVLREKLSIAIKEGNNAFHLS